MTRSHYRRQLLRLYRLLPDTPHRFHHGDRVIVDQLFDQDLPLTVLQAALLLGSARRACRDPRLPKLQPIRSLAYFLPILRELPTTPPPRGVPRLSAPHPESRLAGTKNRLAAN